MFTNTTVGTLKPYLKGAAGALVVAVLIFSGLWVNARWQEFKFMRQIISQSVDASRQRLASQPQPQKPTPSPEVPTKK